MSAYFAILVPGPSAVPAGGGGHGLPEAGGQAGQAGRVAAGPGLWEDWLAGLRREGLIGELLADGVIAAAVAEGVHGHRRDRALTAEVTALCVYHAVFLLPDRGCRTTSHGAWSSRTFGTYRPRSDRPIRTSGYVPDTNWGLTPSRGGLCDSLDQGYDLILARVFGMPGVPVKPGTVTPSGPALSKARDRLGEQVMRRIFELDAARPDIVPGAGGTAFGLELTVFDGTTAEVFNDPGLAEEFGVPEGGTSRTSGSSRTCRPARAGGRPPRSAATTTARTPWPMSRKAR